MVHHNLKFLNYAVEIGKQKKKRLSRNNKIAKQNHPKKLIVSKL